MNCNELRTELESLYRANRAGQMNTKTAANSAAHRHFKKKYGGSYRAKKGIDFTVSHSFIRGGWYFAEITR